jgi:hypothetical protein
MEAASVVQDDLTKTISQHLDRHLVFPMLEFLSGLNLYPEEDLLQAKLSLIAKTNMVDYAITYHKQLNGTEEVPEDLATRRQAVIDRLEALSDDAKQIIDIFQNKDIVARFRTDKNFNLQYLKENHNVLFTFLNSFDHDGLILNNSLIQLGSIAYINMPNSNLIVVIMLVPQKCFITLEFCQLIPKKI